MEQTKTQKFNTFTGPRRFIFVDPDTEHEYKDTTKDGLVAQITNYRKQNNLSPIEHIDMILDVYWCNLPENTGSCHEVDLPRGFIQFMKGGIFLIKNIFYGSDNMVSPAVAEARAFVCTSCPHNVFPNKGDFVKWSDELAMAATGGHPKIPSHDKLGNCDICTCPLRAKVHAKGPFQLSVEERAKMTALGYCWQTK